MDFISWFFSKHYYMAAFLQPEIAVIYGVYMRWPYYPWVIGAALFVKKFVKAIEVRG